MVEIVCVVGVVKVILYVNFSDKEYLIEVVLCQELDFIISDYDFVQCYYLLLIEVLMVFGYCFVCFINQWELIGWD